MNETINQIRQLLCQPDTPALRSEICALCTEPWMLEMAEQSISGLGTWWERQKNIAEALERHKQRNDEGANYYECQFRMKGLSGADLCNADLRHADLFNANLRRADLSNADLCNTDLFNANLRRADLSNADLRNANLTGTDLEDADLFNADLRRARYNKHTQFPAGFDPVARGMVEATE